MTQLQTSGAYEIFYACMQTLVKTYPYLTIITASVANIDAVLKILLITK